MNTTHLNSIIRSSLAAASAALTMLEQQAQDVTASGACAAVTGACPSYKPVVETASPIYTAPDESSPFDKLMTELEDPRYTLRSMLELREKTGIYEILDALNDNGVEYVTKTRRSDGAQLVGLESRN